MNLLNELKREFPNEEIEVRERKVLDTRRNEDDEDEDFVTFYYTVFINGEDSGATYFIKEQFKEYDFNNNVGPVIIKNTKEKIMKYLESVKEEEEIERPGEDTEEYQTDM